MSQIRRQPQKSQSEAAREGYGRLQKVLAGSGLGSRRKVEDLISAGLVTVDGRLARLGQKVGATDDIRVSGRSIGLADLDVKPRVLVYHKPPGEIVSHDDPKGRPTVFDNLPPLVGGRWLSVGRLDFNTSGLLLLTNSGQLANQLMHPSSGLEREYAVRVRGRIPEAQEKQLLAGILLSDGLAKFERIEMRGGGGANTWYHVVLLEGRNREVRRIFEAIGLVVSRLIRVRFGDLKLPARLRPGKFEELPLQAVTQLSFLTRRNLEGVQAHANSASKIAGLGDSVKSPASANRASSAEMGGQQGGLALNGLPYGRRGEPEGKKRRHRH